MASAGASAASASSDSAEPFLSRTNKKFESVRFNDEGAISTKDFLRSLTEIPDIFVLIMGKGKVADTLSNDVRGNISSLVKVYKAKKFKTLSLCPDSSPAISESPRVKLLWLKRGLNMIYQLMVTIPEKPSETTSACAKIAYNNSLSQHHNFIMRGVASMGLGMGLPDRDQLYKVFQTTKDGFNKEAARFKKVFGPILSRLHKVLKEMKQETCDLAI